jgi:hypothetical protein
MAEQKPKTVAVTLRVKEDLHLQMKEVATNLGIDINSLLNIMINRWLGHVAAEAHAHNLMVQDSMNVYVEMMKWMKANPSRRRNEFYVEHFNRVYSMKAADFLAAFRKRKAPSQEAEKT